MAYPIAPYVADGLGRKSSILIGALLACMATALQASSQSVEMFIGARSVYHLQLIVNTLDLTPFSRLLLGFGNTFAANAAPLLVTEIAYPSHRAPLTATYNTLYYTGSIA